MCLLLCLITPSVSKAQLWTQQTPTFLLPSDIGLKLAQFGYSTSLTADGNTAIVGAKTLRIGDNSFQGAAYIYTRTSGVWTQKQQLVATVGRENDNFGSSVSFSADGRIALIGAIERTNLRGGKACIFVNINGTWVQKAEFKSSEAATYDDFGAEVCLSADGNTAIVSAPQKSYGFAFTSGQGVCYFFTRTNDSTWVQRQVIKPLMSSGLGGEKFGTSVSLSSDANTLLIGAPSFQTGDNGRGMGAGKVYIFKRVNNVWTQQQGFLAADSNEGDQFGYDVSLSGDGNTALIGAYYKTVGATERRGKVYIFAPINNTWVEQYTLTPPNRDSVVSFGESVAFSSDGYTALIGTTGTLTGQGKGYVFARTNSGWVQQSELLASDGQSQDYFGSNVSLSSNGNTAFIGAHFRRNSIGGVHVFIRNPNATVDHKLETAVNIYPSVTSDFLTVELEKSGTELSLDIANAIGQIVKTQKIQSSSTVDMRPLLRGLYFVSVRDATGKISTQKVVKE